MKDSNDNATLDWVDFVGEPEVIEDGELIMPTYAPENPALNTALTKIVNVTLQDLLAEYN